MQDFLIIDGKKIKLSFVINKRSRKIILRPNENEIKITIPSRWHLRASYEFAMSKVDWIAKQLEKKQTPKLDTDEIIFLDKTYKVVSTPERLGVRIDGDIIFVSGNPEFKERRLKDFLKNQLQIYAEKKAAEFCKSIGKKYNRISIKSVSSRHGSCSSSGNLCFSDKLIFAPIFVVDYVIAHEVAHLQEMNHSENFWTVCERLYGTSPTRAKLWLKLKI